MDIDFISVDKDMSIEDLLQNVRTNVSSLNALKTENQLLENASLERKVKSLSETSIEENVEEYSYITESLNDTNEDDLSDEALYYLDEIKKLDLNLDENTLIQSLVDILPGRASGNYLDIIKRINLELFKEIKEINEFMFSEAGNLTKEEIESFNNEILYLYKLINLINKSQFYKETEIEEQKRNTIVFLPTNKGNIYVYDDLEHIDDSYYEGFLELIGSIVDGTFKNVKTFRNNIKVLTGISQVKSFAKRVYFDRVDKNTYLIIGASTKKSDFDKDYVEFLKNRVAIYKARKDELLTHINDPEFIKENEVILDNLVSLLRKDNISKKGVL